MNTPFPRDGRGPKPMPGHVKSALTKRKLMDAYRARPEYQRNDYLIWLEGAKVSQQREQRMSQFLDELTRGDVYMGEPWSPPAPVTK